MKLAIIHNHLNRGGVVRVIANQLLALDRQLDPADPWSVALVYSGRREGWDTLLSSPLAAIRLSLHEVPLLDDDAIHRKGGARAVGQLHARLTALLSQIGFASGETVVHVHNHALGMNRALPQVAARLAAEGYALLLQIHDFAEDFRPDNYRHLCQGRPPKPWKRWSEVLYPQAAHVHYALLNRRDHGVLQSAGVAAKRLHLLPNPIAPPGELPARADARRRLAEQYEVGPQDRFVHYPVRCVRRKNVGEVLLLSALAPPGTVFGLALAPLEPQEQVVYLGWKQMAEQLRLPCLFEVVGSGRMSLADTLAAADLTLSTSLAEGFGMVFLESWLAGQPLVGRDLPEVTADFRAAGLRFDWLWSRLAVPLEWIGAERFGRSVVWAYRGVLAAYGCKEPQEHSEALAQKTRDGLVDFGDLDETFQRQVIQAASRSDANRRRLFQANPILETIFSLRADQAAETVRRNAERVEGQFSLVPGGAKLLDVYRQVAASPRGDALAPLPQPERILEGFLSLTRFRMIGG
jgi:hypothetical protein